MIMYHSIEYSDNYSKTSRILWQYCKEKPALADYGTIVDFTADNVDTDSFKTKQKKNNNKKTDQTDDNGLKNFKIMVPLKYLNNFLENS